MSTGLVLKPERGDPAWDDFCEKLLARLGGLLPGRCGGHRSSHHYARRLLIDGGYDVGASLALYRSRGGFCDCEILFNVDPEQRIDELFEVLVRE